MPTNRELLEQGYTAYARKDFASIMQLMHPGIEAYQSTDVPWGGTYSGLAEYDKFMAKLAQYVDTVVEPEEIIDAGDHAVMIGWSRGSVRATGRQFRVRVVHVWRFEDGKARRLEVYLDTPAQLAALGR
jgi:ketosteroid isomerase-like protein